METFKLIANVINSLLHLTTPEQLIYKNWKGETNLRKVAFLFPWYGKTEYHPEYQFFMRVWDWEKKDFRDYAIKDIIYPIVLREKQTFEKIEYTEPSHGVSNRHYLRLNVDPTCTWIGFRSEKTETTFQKKSNYWVTIVPCIPINFYKITTKF
jgi:hypothetical protein